MMCWKIEIIEPERDGRNWRTVGEGFRMDAFSANLTPPDIFGRLLSKSAVLNPKAGAPFECDPDQNDDAPAGPDKYFARVICLDLRNSRLARDDASVRVGLLRTLGILKFAGITDLARLSPELIDLIDEYDVREVWNAPLIITEEFSRFLEPLARFFTQVRPGIKAPRNLVESMRRLRILAMDLASEPKHGAAVRAELRKLWSEYGADVESAKADARYGHLVRRVSAVWQALNGTSEGTRP